MYQEKDIVQDLYNEIEHLIDIPFDKSSNNLPYEVVQQQQHDFHYKNDEEYDEEEQQQQGEQQRQEEANDYTFERPILIESDSDDIEEEITTPGHDQDHQYQQPYSAVSTCCKCDKPIPYQPTLTVSNTNQLCAECSSSSSSKKNKGGKRSRSNSFTFSQLADKLKQSFGHSSSSNFLSPTGGVKSVDRRKSMPSMNSIFNNDQLEPPSPQPSRPSSRASSFIEDVVQFLNPLSRKSSRNSMYQDYNAAPELKRKTSHNSLLDAINICKPKHQQHNSYEKRVIQDENSWMQEDEEVMGVHTNGEGGYFQENYTPVDHIVPLRRKQIKQIESRQDRMDIYNNAYMEVMSMETNLVPWIIKQTQKGPPDAWFGYTPPAREPKKVLGLFKKRKPKTTPDLRAQQQQLGDELLNRSTPLLQHRYSNSNLSRSPSNQSAIDQHVTSPSAITAPQYQDEVEGTTAYFDRFTSPASYSSFDPRSPSTQTSFSPSNNLDTIISRSPSTQQQPASILKKTNSNINMHNQYPHQQQQQPQSYDDYDEEEVDQYDNNLQQEEEYDDQEEEMYSDDHHQHYALPPLQQKSPRQKQQRSSSRPSSAVMMDEYHCQHQKSIPAAPKEKRSQQQRYSSSPGNYQQKQIYMLPPQMTGRGRSNSGSYRSDYDRENYYNNYHSQQPTHHHQRPSSRDHRQQQQQQQYYEDEEVEEQPQVYYNDSIALNKKKKTVVKPRHHYEEEQEQEYYDDEDKYYPSAEHNQQQPPQGRRKSANKKEQDYYGLSVKLTPYMMEEWEIALDDLCDLYPRLDRHYINDFLRSAQGDFVTAKDMIMDMIMEIR